MMPALHRSLRPVDFVTVRLKGGGTLAVRTGLIQSINTPAPGILKDKNGKAHIVDGSYLLVSLGGTCFQYHVEDEVDEILQKISVLEEDGQEEME